MLTVIQTSVITKLHPPHIVTKHLSVITANINYTTLFCSVVTSVSTAY